MKIFLIAGVTVILLFAGFKYVDWYRYSSSNGHFSASFPAKPDESADKQTTADGTPFDIDYVTYSPSDSEVYMIGYIDMNGFYPSDKSLKDILENSRDGATGSLEATSANTLAINLEGNPYMEFTFTGAKIAGKDRIYVINKFQYSIITIFSASQGISPNADKFINSFSYSN